jgi:hypothetical protein
VGAFGFVRPRLTTSGIARFTVLVATAASLSLAFAARGDEPRRTIDVSRALDAGSPPLPVSVNSFTPTPPDPEPLVECSQWVFDLRWDRGDVWLLDVRPMNLPAPQATPRVMGRFALELFEGKALIERVRFDFPLLGAAEMRDGGPSGEPSLSAKLRTRIGVIFPATSRGTRLELLDRATQRRWSIPWPPVRTPERSEGLAR